MVVAQQQEEDRRAGQEQDEMNVALINALVEMVQAIAESQKRDESQTSLLRSAVYEMVRQSTQNQTGILDNSKPAGEPFEIKTIPQAFWALNRVIDGFAPYVSPDDVGLWRAQVADSYREYVMNLMSESQADLNHDEKMER